MANEDQLKLIRQRVRSVEVWNRWRKENRDLLGLVEGLIDNPCLVEGLRGLSMADIVRYTTRNADIVKADLSGASLCEEGLVGTDFRGTDLHDVDLSAAHLSDADLTGADLSNANLNGAHLVGVKLIGADLNNTNLSNADLTGADLSWANLNDADLSAADLSRASLVETTLVRTKLTGCRIYGISAWGLKLDETEQRDLVITPENQPTVTVDNIEVAQFVYLLLHNKKIRQVIDTITSKVVLILGRFTPERKAVLDAIREELRKRGYVPVLFDFDKPNSRDITEIVTTLARLARFIIADITDPKSIPLELQSIVPDLAVPVQPLLLEGSSEFSMFRDLRRKYHWVLQVHTYRDPADLFSSFDEKVIAPAVAKANELRDDRT